MARNAGRDRGANEDHEDSSRVPTLAHHGPGGEDTELSAAGQHQADRRQARELCGPPAEGRGAAAARPHDRP
eukprot:scaffold669744_cov45-Prasinocladus_malaysianus.AAC.1